MDIYDLRNQLNNGISIFELQLRVTFYARVSTEKDEQVNSLDNQIGYYKDFITGNPNWRYVKGYVDEGISGTSVKKRLSFLKMIEDAKKGMFDFVITKEISRFSRNTMDSIQYTQELLKYGVGVLFQSDNINTLSPDAELRLTIMSSIAQDEVRKISERVKFGFKRAIKKGVVLGSSNIWGYKKENGRLVIDEEQAVVIREIFQLYAVENMGIRTICKQLSQKGFFTDGGNEFSFSTIRGILCNPKYKGYYCGNKTHKIDYKLSKVKHLDQEEWITYKDEEAVPPIVSEAIWEKANEILQTRSEKMIAEDKTSYQNKYPYSGLIFCAHHGTPYYRTLQKSANQKKEVWHCKIYNGSGKAGCSSPSLYKDELDALMKQLFDLTIRDKKGIALTLSKIYEEAALQLEGKNESDRLMKDITTVKKLKDKLLFLCMNGNISCDEFEIKNNELNEKLEQLKEKEILLKKKTEPLSLTEAIYKELAENRELPSVLLHSITVDPVQEEQIQLKIHLHITDNVFHGTVFRKRKKASVCSVQYI